jgi:hypothetical protein
LSTRNPAPATAVVVFAIASLVAACSGSALTESPAATLPLATSSPAPTPSPSGTPAASAELVLRVTTEGGFIGPAAHLAQLPEVAVYADGRIFTPAPVPAIYPGPLVPVESVRNVGAGGVAAIRAAIAAAGLDAGGGTSPGIAPDAPDTVFEVGAGDQTVTTRFPALGGGPGPGQPGLPGASTDPRRARAEALLARLTDPTDPWGAPATASTPYTPTAYRIFVAPGAPADAGLPSPPVPVAWPLATPLASFGKPAQPDRGISGLRVGVVSLADTVTLGSVLAAATQITPFTSGGESYTLYVTPLLPDEAGQ